MSYAFELRTVFKALRNAANVLGKRLARNTRQDGAADAHTVVILGF